MPYKDREKRLASGRNNYSRNREKRIKKTKQQKKEVRLWINTFKSKCARCPETDVRCLEFHHIDPSKKEFNIMNMAHNFGKEKILKEMAKCVVLCANCHCKLRDLLPA